MAQVTLVQVGTNDVNAIADVVKDVLKRGETYQLLSGHLPATEPLWDQAGRFVAYADWGISDSMRRNINFSLSRSAGPFVEFRRLYRE